MNLKRFIRKHKKTNRFIFFSLLACTLHGCQPQQTSLNCGSFQTVYKTDDLIDHSFIYNNEDKQWHLFGIIHPDTSFIHLTASSLRDTNWKREANFTDHGKNIWAPHIIKNGDLFYMFYTRIGKPREICYATSKDLYHWNYNNTPVLAQTNEYTDDLKNKDPMIFYDENQQQWIMYYSMMKNRAQWVVGYSTSKDLKSWSAYKICFDEDTSSPGVESPFVIKHNDEYLLFLSAAKS